MKSVRAGVGAAAVTAIVGAMLTAPGWGSAAEPERDSARRAPQRVVEARRHFFGSRNVDPRTGRVDPHKIILSWFGVSSFAASFGGHVVLLDAFVLRGYENDVPTTVDEVAALRPKAIFMGHTHGDHAGDLAELATRTGATVVGTPEHCRYARDQAGEAKIDCMTPVAAGAEPGAHSTFSPFPGLTVAAVKHLHSEQKPPTGTREPCPPPPTPPGDGPSHESGDYDWLLQPQVEGGSMLYQFRVGRFALTMHDSSGPIDRKAPRVVRVLRRLPRSDVQVGAVGSNGMFT
ncbi:MAG: MBL fold metallo-hydrolase, partial [Actinomycetota bacterium]